MKRTLACPSCGVGGVVVAHAVVAPWICELADLSSPQESQLVDCPDCGMSYFSLRYEDEDMEHLYSHYRGSRYVEVRRQWEPWYREAINSAFEPGSAATRARVDFLETALQVACGDRPWHLMVDVGGDAGQFFPTSGSGRRVLIDPSNKPLPSGVERAAQLADLDARPDLVMIAHVLEHLPDPRSVLNEIWSILADDGRLYVELPADRPRTSRLHTGVRFRRGLDGLARHRRPFVAADFVSGAIRQFGIPVVPLPVIKQSEHLNYFNRRSVTELLQSTGFIPEHIASDPRGKPNGLRMGLLAVVARKRES